jgi:hypothetical protein
MWWLTLFFSLLVLALDPNPTFDFPPFPKEAFPNLPPGFPQVLEIRSLEISYTNLIPIESPSLYG